MRDALLLFAHATCPAHPPVVPGRFRAMAQAPRVALLREVLDASALARRAITVEDRRAISAPNKRRVTPLAAEVLLVLFVDGPRSAGSLHLDYAMNYATVRHAFSVLAQHDLVERHETTRTGETFMRLTPEGEDAAAALAMRVYANVGRAAAGQGP